MNRRRLLAIFGSVVFGAGCTQRLPRSGDSTPTEEPVDTGENLTPDSAGTNAPDCTMDRLVIFNELSTNATVSLRLLEGRGRYRGGSPTATRAGDSTETSPVAFGDDVDIPAGGKREYDDLPETNGSIRVKLSVEDGPTRTEVVSGTQWGTGSVILATIRHGGVEFDHALSVPPTGC